MKQLFSFLLLGLWASNHLPAQITFSEHIAPIIYNNCTSCHREGEIGPFPLTNYNEVASWGQMIEYVTQIGYMPPWKPDPSYSTFVGEKGLTPQELQLISDWVDAGSPQGDPSLEPPLPVFPTGSQLGTPDLVLEMSQDYVIEGNNEDDYRVFVIPTGLTEDKEIAAVEFRPGNTKAVHHALLAYETNGIAANMDAQEPGYGYEAFGGFGVPIQGNFTGYTPGIQSVFFPEGIGATLPAGADLLMQIHYAPLPTNESDRSLVNIFFKDNDDPIVREVQRAPITPMNLDGGFLSFQIPPEEVVSFHGTEDIEEDISLLSVYPHSHYLGKDWELYAVTPGNDTLHIIRINEWDFNWQGAYTFKNMLKIPAGSVMHIYATYDNTSSNPYNPSNPPQTVRWGEGTADEMYLVGTTFVPYQEGDEDIVIGGDLTTDIVPFEAASEIRLAPNPATGKVNLSYTLEGTRDLYIGLFDMQGSLVRKLAKGENFSPGIHDMTFDVQDLAAGVYAVRIHTDQAVSTRQLIITR